jgi:hypothetical protein
MSQLIPYRILDPAGQFPASYRNAIKASADAWSHATSGLIGFQECSHCVGRFVSIVPGDGDGIVPSLWEQVVPLPVDAASLARIPLHRIAHQWGHVLGLGHTYERADRDRYVRFDPALWCGAQTPGVPPRCALGPDEVGSPRIPSDTFGAYDEKSKMNAFRIQGVCGTDEPDAMSGEPTAGDAAAVQELFFSQTSNWAPFQPLGRSQSATQPLDFQLEPGVDPTGAPAITTWMAPAVEIFARGTDGGVYGMHNDVATTVFQGWSAWQRVGIGVDADPAVAFADADTLHLVVRLTDKSIRLRTRLKGAWGTWASLGAPPGGAASAPALAVRDNQSLDVVVLGNDGLLYEMTCTDPAALCAASAARPDAWTSLPWGPAPFVGQPSADWTVDGNWLMVAAVTNNAQAWLMGGLDANFAASGWEPLPLELDPVDPEPHTVVQNVAGGQYLFARDPRRALVSADFINGVYPALGGVLASAPNVVVARHGVSRIDVVALIEDHGRPGVWWKFFSGDGGYTPPCNYNLPGTCAQCGCNVPNSPSCFQ